MLHAVIATPNQDVVSTFRVSLVRQRGRSTEATGFSIEKHGRLSRVLNESRQWAGYLRAKGYAQGARILLVEDVARPSSQYMDANPGFPFTAPVEEDSDPVETVRIAA